MLIFPIPSSPSGVQDDCFIDTVDFDNYSVRFMPKENGLNNIHIKFNQVHIPGSPFRIKVGKDDADPACVHAHGKGLEGIKTGQKTDFFIDTANAGAGHLAGEEGRESDLISSMLLSNI
jgi:filamin